MTDKKKPLTANQRKAIERKTKRGKGFKKKETWVHKTEELVFDKFINKLKKP